MNGICKLCGQQKTLQYSHIFPAFAVRWLKETSLTGYLTTLKSKVRVQETRRVYLLCSDCEQILGRDEKTFCEEIFIPYHEQNQQQFKYDSWLRRFIVGLHWKVLVTKQETYPAEAEAAYAKAESDWRQFLSGQSASPGDAEFHLFLSDVVEDSTGVLPQKINWYLARGFDATPIYNEAGVAGVYAMVIRTSTFSYLTPRAAQDKMVGTQIGEHGVLRTGQQIGVRLGSFIVGRAKAIEQFPKTLSARQKEKLFERASKEPERFLQSEGFRAFEADRSLKEKMSQKLIRQETVANRQRRLAAALSIGCVFALLTWIMLEPPFRSQRFDYLLRPTFYFVLPGALTSMIIGGNVHIVSMWIAAVANFAFYFGLTHLAFTIRLRRKPNPKND